MRDGPASVPGRLAFARSPAGTPLPGLRFTYATVCGSRYEAAFGIAAVVERLCFTRLVSTVRLRAGEFEKTTHVSHSRLPEICELTVNSVWRTPGCKPEARHTSSEDSFVKVIRLPSRLLCCHIINRWLWLFFPHPPCRSDCAG